MKKFTFLIVLITLMTGCSSPDQEPPLTQSPTSTATVSDAIPPTLTPTSPPTDLSEVGAPAVTPFPTPNLAKIPNKNVNAQELLSKYGWTIKGLLGHHEVILPTTFLHEPGDFPISIYWAYNNELSSAIGLNFKPYLGTQVHAIIYALNESPFIQRSDIKARGIILLSRGKIIGAWIDAGRGLDMSRSLDEKTFHEIVGLSWGEWLLESGVVDKENDLDKKLANMSQTQIIHGYYDALNDHDYDLAYVYLSRKKLVDYLFLNMLCCAPGGEGMLFQNSYEDGLTRWESPYNIKSIHINDMTNNGQIHGIVEYYENTPLQVAGDYYKFIVFDYTDSLGYRISEINTGP